MKILITGGSGFIGTHVSEILNKNHSVKIFDSRKPSSSSLGFINGDITDLQSVITKVGDCDVVIHLAAVVGVERTETDPIKTLDVNIGGTKNVLEACRANDIKKIIFSSSSEVYGEPLKVPTEETDATIPITVYGVSKLAAEEYVKSYAKNYGIKYSILRFFSVYGPGQSINFVIPRFVSLAIEHQPITIHGDGSQIRTFCHVKDIANAIALALEGGDNEIFNIGNDNEPISIKELAQKVVNTVDSESNLVFLPFEESNRNRIKEIMHRIPNIEKAKELLGYEPVVSLEEGINTIIRTLRSGE